MRVVYLAAGAGGMYCGSCLRDNRLVAALRDGGRDVLLVPLYTPLRTDEPDVSTKRVAFGGVNVWLDSAFAPYRRAPSALRRLLDSRPVLQLAGRFSARTAATGLGPLTLAVLRGEEGPQRRELDRLVEHVAELRPRLVNLANLLFVGQAKRLREALGIPILCTLSGEDLFIDQLPAPWRDDALAEIRRRAADVDGFIAVTRYFAERAADYFGLPAECIHHVPLGIHPEPFAAGKVEGLADAGRSERNKIALTIGYFARVAPEKGLHALVDAVLDLHRAGRAVSLRVGGYRPATAAAYFREQWKRLEDGGLAERCEDWGELDLAGKTAFFRGLDVLSVPAVYPEAKGLYVLEAMAAGVPVVQPRAGSFPELVDATGGGLLYDPAEKGALVRALARLIDEPALRCRLAKSGQAAVAQQFTARQMAERTWQVYERYASRS